MGMFSIRERAAIIGAKVDFISQGPSGTIVIIEVNSK
jgi:signal transduction histidine kinase